MVEISRDGERVYFTNSLCSTWDDQCYPDEMTGTMVMVLVSSLARVAEPY
jgi:selenium-binding protein 1